MKSSNKRMKVLNGYYKSSKSVVTPAHQTASGSKNLSRKQGSCFGGSPYKFDLNVVDSIQHGKVRIQESGNEEAPVPVRTQRANKYKGKSRYNRAVHKPTTQASAVYENMRQRKRSLKREDKEKESMEENSINNQKQYSKAKSVVNFKNLNSKESVVSNKSSRSSRMAESAPRAVTRGGLHPIPPKSEVLKELDKHWVQDLPEGLTKKQKQQLLSLEDQAERNRELSRMTGSEVSSIKGNKSSLAVLRVRKSHVRTKPKTLNTFNHGRKLDEIHFEKFIKSQKISKQKESPAKSKYTTQPEEEKPSAIEIVSKIRARGEKARLKSLHSTPKSTPKQRKLKKTPTGKSKMTPIPFPALDSDEKSLGSENKLTSARKLLSPGSTEEDQIKDLKSQTTGISKFEPDNKPIAIIEKVQTPNKDISVPLVTEIQRKPLVDSSLEMSARLPPRPVIGKLTPTPQGQAKQVVESIKERIGNLRSPAKITNRLILPVEETSMQPLMDTDSEFKTPLPKKPRSASKKEAVKKNKEVVTTFPMRIDFNERPKEYDQIILPKKLQLIFDFFCELDNAINNCKRRGKIPVLSNLKPYIEQATNRTFDIDHFRKVYYVAPELYFYTWQTVAGSTTQDIRIEIPENIEEIITKVHKRSINVEVRQSPIGEPMTNFLNNKRKIIMRTRLILYIENLHKNFLMQQECKNTEYNAVKGWHPNFDIESVMDLQKKTLKNMPKSKKGETITEFLKNKNIKNTLLKRQAEGDSNALKSDMQQASQSTGHSSLAYPSPEKRSPAKIGTGVISPSFYKRIQTKEKIYKEEKKRLEDESQRGESKRKIELMLKIAQAVKSVFSVKGKVNTLFLNHVLKYLNDSQRGNFYSKKELITTLQEISQVVPEWLTLKKHDRGFLVKI